MRRFVIVFTLLLLFVASGANSQTITDTFIANIWADGSVDGDGSGFEADDPWAEYSPWFPYPSGWVNQWFYDHPFDPLRGKIIHIEFDLVPIDPDEPYGIAFAVNWSTPEWSLLGYGDTWPPIPEGPGDPFDEGLYIVREELIGSLGEPAENPPLGDYAFDYIIWDYNPEWVSIDIQGYNVIILDGIIEHECVEKIFGTEENSWGAIKSVYR